MKKLEVCDKDSACITCPLIGKYIALKGTVHLLLRVGLCEDEMDVFTYFCDWDNQKVAIGRHIVCF